MDPTVDTVMNSLTLPLGTSVPVLTEACTTSVARDKSFDARPLRRGVKRLIDLVGATGLALCAAPLLLGIPLLIRLHGDQGPVVYRQRRIGRDGQPFSCLKFRSMYVEADRVLHELLARDEAARIEWNATRKLRKDPRITPIGRLLRSTSLDELPQIWNILAGEMSLVGPRPITQDEVDGPYTLYGGRQQYLSVRPGLTGLWQVSGRSGVCYERRVELDKIYVRDMSLIRDLVILCLTVRAVLRRDGAC